MHAATLPRLLVEALADYFRTDLGKLEVHPSALPRGPVAALASGTRIAFAPEAYRPDTSWGIRIVAHEVAHLIQQASGSVPERTAVIDTALEEEADRAADGFLQFLSGERVDRPWRKTPACLRPCAAAQPLIVNFSTLYGKGKSVHHSITVNDALRLEQMYSDKSKDFDSISDFPSLLGKNDILVMNAHGNDEELDDYSPDTLVDFMAIKGFKGACKEVHLYACEVGRGVSAFGQKLAQALYDKYAVVIPVWAPIGSLYWKDSEKRFRVERTKSADYDYGTGWVMCLPKSAHKVTSYGSSDSAFGSSPSPPPKKKGCFFSIVTLARGLGDDCFELDALRHLRNFYVLALPGGEAERDRYARISNELIPWAAAQQRAERTYDQVYREIVLPCARLSEPYPAAAHALYRREIGRLVRSLRSRGPW